MRLSRWKYDRSIKAGQTIGLETSRTGLETDWKKKRALWLQPQSPAETFRMEMPRKKQFYLKAFP